MNLKVLLTSFIVCFITSTNQARTEPAGGYENGTAQDTPLYSDASGTVKMLMAGGSTLVITGLSPNVPITNNLLNSAAQCSSHTAVAKRHTPGPGEPPLASGDIRWEITCK